MFLVVLEHGKGPINIHAIAQLESFLIRTAHVKDPKLSNRIGMKDRGITGIGVLGLKFGREGEPPPATEIFCQAIGLTIDASGSEQTHTASAAAAALCNAKPE